MKNEYIEFKKQRELGEILSDTFAFLRAEFKPFFNTYLKIVGPFLLVMILAIACYMYYVGDITAFSFLNNNTAYANPFTILLVTLAYFCAIITVYTMSQATVLHYIKSYTNGKGETNFNTIQKEVYGGFWNFIGLGIMVGISVMIGLIFCIIPGVYLYVPLTLSFSIMVFNKMGVSDAYSYSFKLVKDEWWITFATMFVIGIITYIASLAFAIPTLIYQILKMGVFSGELDAETMTDTMKDPVYIALNVVSSLGQFIMNLLSIIGAVFIYFNLNEKKNFTGTYERIENLGKTSEL